MAYRVHYGFDKFIEIPELPTVQLAEPPGARTKEVQDPATATRAALARPMGLPPLTDCLTGEDDVVLAIRRGTPCSAEIASVVVENVLQRLGPTRPVTVLRTEADAVASRGDPRHLLGPDHADRVVVKTHQSQNTAELAYLTRFEDGRILRLNRSLVEADVVIPIGGTQFGGTWARYSAFGAIFPAFADHAAHQRHWREVVERIRYRKLGRAGKAAKSPIRPAAATSREADWLLGMQFALEVVPGPLGTVLQVLAGEMRCVAKEARDQCASLWGFAVEQPSELVIAGVDHNPAHSTWEDLAQAAWAAAQCVIPGGHIVLLTDWEGPAPAPATLELSPGDIASRGSWTDIIQEFGDRIVPLWILSRVRRRASLCVWSPNPPAPPAWADWAIWLGIETSTRPEAVQQWVRAASSVLLFSHATLLWPRRGAEKRDLRKRSDNGSGGRGQ